MRDIIKRLSSATIVESLFILTLTLCIVWEASKIATILLSVYAALFCIANLVIIIAVLLYQDDLSSEVYTILEEMVERDNRLFFNLTIGFCIGTLAMTGHAQSAWELIAAAVVFIINQCVSINALN